MSSATSKPDAAQPAFPALSLAPRTSRPILVAVAGLSALAGFLVTSPDAAAAAVANAGPELARLLRAMAGLKMLMAGGAAAGMLWRLGSQVSPAWLAAYLACCAAMAAAPGLIWNMAHVGAGALLLHGGLLASLVLLWRDPATRDRLSDVIARRRQRVGRVRS